MSKSEVFYTSFSAFVLSIIILIFNLQRGEVQPWDEGLYAYRAREILTTNKWWDQTSVSIGGLYSSTYPPLVSWAIAINMKIFGENLFSIRLFSVVCSAIAIFLFIYFISSHFDQTTTFLVGVNLLFSSHWLFYSRQGMTDIPLLLFILANIFSTMAYLAENNKTKKIVTGFLISCTFYLALMTKIVLSFVPLLILIFIYRYFGSKTFLKVSFLFLLGFLLALPWYFYMGLKYGNAFLSALLPPHLFSVVEGNTKQLGVLYYINQLLIASPISILSFSAIYVRLKTKKISDFFLSNNLLSDVFFFWFIGGLIVFSFAPTKLPHYTLYILLPSFYLICELIELHFTNLKHLIRFWTIVLLFLNVFWYFTPSLRQSIKQMELTIPPFALVPLLISLIIVFIIYWVEKQRKTETFFSLKFVTTFVLVITSINIVIILLNEANFPTGKVFGGEKTAEFLRRENIRKFIYLFHKVNDSDTLNPQLAWYTNGEFFGKRQDKSIIFFPLPVERIGLYELKQLEKYPNEYIVYYTYTTNLPRKIIVEELMQERKVFVVTPNYIIFGKKEKVKKERDEKII